MKIDKAILQKTTDCKKNFECLNNENHIFCKVESVVSDKVLFVKCIYTYDCNYKLPFGQEIICTCPTRKAIFNKYGI